jgi:hypothetical protein
VEYSRIFPHWWKGSFGQVCSGQFVYVANASSPDAQGHPVGDVSMYAITGTGTLRPLGTVRAGTGPVAVTIK